MTNLTNLTITEALKLLDKKEITSQELTKAHIDNCEKYNNELNAYITTTYDLALSKAKQSDEKRQNNQKLGLMEGIPIAVKDLFCTKGIKTTASSKILQNFVPTYESTVTKNLFNNGAIMLGKVSCDEFAMGSTNMTSYFGNVKSPWKNQKGEHTVPGGSSGGSSSAVSARMAMAATGTDTGGSIRQPASFTGTVGLKPTYGTCSRWGTVAFASSLDQAGPITRSVADCALMLNAMASHDKKDSTTIKRKLPNFVESIKDDIKGLKVGFPKEYITDDMDPEISQYLKQTAKILEDHGAEIIDISLPTTKYALACYYIIAPAEASSNLARYDGVKYGFRAGEDFESLDDMYIKTRTQGFGDEVKRRILIGTHVLSAGFYDAYFLKAQKIRRLIVEDFQKSFKKIDVILTPTTANTSFSLSEKPTDPIALYLQDLFSVPASMAGLPALSLPIGLAKNKLPLGIQLISNYFKEDILIKTAYKIEQTINFDDTPTILQG